MNVSRYIAGKYLRRRGDKQASVIRIISFIASLGVLVTAMALIIVLSGFSGLRDFNLKLMDQTGPDLRILPREGKFFHMDSARLDEWHNMKALQITAPVIEEKVYVRYGDKQTVAVMRGVDSLYRRLIHADSILIAGGWPEAGEPGLVLGNALADKLSVRLNDFRFPVELMVPSGGGMLGAASFRRESFVPTGIYQNTLDFEQKYLFVPIDRARKLLHLPPGKVSYIDIDLRDPERLAEVKAQIRKKLPGRLRISDKYEMNRSLLKMLNSENLITYVVGTFIMLIALFNVLGTIIMMILYKKKDRYILQALGMDERGIKNIFFHYGFRMILQGGFAGLLLGVTVIWLQKHFEWVKVPGTMLVYPVALRWENILLVMLTVVLLALLVSWVASRFAGRYHRRQV